MHHIKFINNQKSKIKKKQIQTTVFLNKIYKNHNLIKMKQIINQGIINKKKYFLASELLISETLTRKVDSYKIFHIL